MKPYNPLEKENLGRSVAVSLIKQKAVPLGGITRFAGAGIYAIYYTGSFDAYAPMSDWNHGDEPFQFPIYVGKAIPSGARKGVVDPEISARGSSLYSRLDEHRKSVNQATNLAIEDFWCRFLVVDDIWIPLGESLLIQNFRPIWNSLLDGFGNHDPGAGRFLGAKPVWDTLHPGRHWADRCAAAKWNEAQVRLQIAAFWETHKGPGFPE